MNDSKAANDAKDGAPTRRLRPDTLTSSIVILLAVNVVQRTVGFGRGVLFCRWLDPEALGLWEMAFGFLLLAAPLAVLGLPGSFGRYLVRYQEQGRLRLFLTRTGAWTTGLALAAGGLLFTLREPFARLVFGDPAQSPLVIVMAVCLCAIIFHHFLEAVFAGLKLFRVVSAMQFFQSMAFAAAALSLVVWWRPAAESLVIGYGLACAAASAGVLAWALLRRQTGDAVAEAGGDSGVATTHREFWPPLLRFAIGLWVANLLCNLFSIIDRYMILHFGGFTSEEALEQIGNYHTSCIVPVLLISVANLLVGAATPHLSHDWERGDRQRVSDRLNRLMQWCTLGMLAAGAGVLLFCPGLFRLAFEEKYAAGLAVLPWTVASCVWFSMLLVSQTYAWCAERSAAAAAPLSIALVVNVLLNLQWLPIWGLAGAVAATAIATLVALYAQLAVNERLGMRLSPATLVLGLSPIVLAGGAACAAIAMGTAALVAALLWVARGSLLKTNLAPTNS